MGGIAKPSSVSGLQSRQRVTIPFATWHPGNMTIDTLSSWTSDFIFRIAVPKVPRDPESLRKKKKPPVLEAPLGEASLMLMILASLLLTKRHPALARFTKKSADCHKSQEHPPASSPDALFSMDGSGCKHQRRGN